MSLTVSVVIPARDDAEGIGRCVAAVLAQDTPPDQVVVVDNGSTDRTAEVATRAGATVISEPRPGSYIARNSGVRVTASEIVAFTDADCSPTSTWLTHLLEPFADAGVGGVSGVVLPSEVRTAPQRWALQRRLLDQETSHHHPFLPFAATANVAYRREVWERLGGFDERMHSGGDVDFAWRMQDQLRLRLVYRSDAAVEHRQRATTKALLQQQRRYGEGHTLLQERWRHHPRFTSTEGTAVQRLRAVWMAPARVPVHLLRHRSASIALLDAAVALARESGRRRARRGRHQRVNS